jgi:hypothetical protein
LFSFLRKNVSKQSPTGLEKKLPQNRNFRNAQQQAAYGKYLLKTLKLSEIESFEIT